MLHRRKQLVPPINTVKHYVHNSNAAVASGAIAVQGVVVAAVAPAVSNSFSVREGAVIKAVYVERWIIGTDTGEVAQFTLVVEKKRQGETNMTHTQSQNLGSYPNKKNILYTTQGIVAADAEGASAIPVIRNWILIPKGKQRFGAGDELVVDVAAVGGLRVCGINTFKEYV